MKLTELRLLRAAGLTGALVSVGVLSSCSLPEGVTWNDVRSRGLIPVFMDRSPANVAAQQPAADSPLRVREIVKPQIATAPYASAVPQRDGYVFSPFVKPQRVIDVREFSAGEEVRCPYTMQAFLVPNFTQVIAKKTPAPEKPKPVAELVSKSDEINLSNLPELSSPPPPESSEQPSGELPLGSRVPGRPGFVYSPYAARNQLVDVAGIAPGVEVKCPYSGRLFRVPELTADEAGAATAPAEVPASSTPVAPSPDVTPEPSVDTTVTPEPSAPAPVVDSLPTATWAQKDKGLVQSPFGNEGQLVDVTGKSAGAQVVCPFTGKSFIVPSAE